MLENLVSVNAALNRANRISGVGKRKIIRYYINYLNEYNNK